MARQRKKRRTHVPKDDKSKAVAGSRPPKSMVIRLGAGTVGANCSQLAQDFRRLMEPDTASRLRERKANKLKDYTAMAGPLGVTHLFLFSRSDSGNTHLRMALTPRGPTLTFRVEKYTLAKDVARAQRHPRTGSQDHLTAPLLVMNNLTTPVEEGQTQDPIQKQLESLATTVFQSMFPAISPHTTPVSSIRRVLLLNRETKLQEQENATYILSLRHYAITTRAAGASRRVRRFDPAAQRAHERKSGPLPHLGRLEDAADYLLDPQGSGYTSASETELDTDAEVEVLETSAQRVLSSKKKKADAAAAAAAASEETASTTTQLDGDVTKRSVKLTELGPRMQLRLIKIEEGICEGKVLWNEFVKKTKREEAEIEAKWDERRREKEQRRAVQRQNVERKRKEREANKKPRADGEGAADDDDDEEDEEWDSDEIEQELERDLTADGDGDIELADADQPSESGEDEDDDGDVNAS